MDLTEAEDINKWWQEYTEGLYKKDINDPDNHNGVITCLEPGIPYLLAAASSSVQIWPQLTSSLSVPGPPSDQKHICIHR